MTAEDLVYRLRKRAEIRRQISTRKSVQEGQPDRLAALLDEAAVELEQLKDARQHEYMTWQIEECISLLTAQAKELGDRHNATMATQRALKGEIWKGAPDAYKASTPWHAVEIIRELQAKIKTLEDARL